MNVPLGPVNHIYNKLKSLYPKIVKTVSRLHIQHSKYHGKSFEGNQCRLLLNNIDKLDIPNNFQEFKDVLLALKKLHILCNSDYLPHNYEQIIDTFNVA